MKSMSRYASAVVVATLMAFAVGAHASDEYVLTYSAKDFQSVDSVKSLYQRIRRLARSHCPDYFRTRDLAGSNDCVNDVVSDLIANIDHPALSAYESGTGDESVRIALEAAARNNQG
jgi:UrcA family protein